MVELPKVPLSDCHSRSVTRQAYFTACGAVVKAQTIVDMTDPRYETRGLGEHGLWAAVVHFIIHQLGGNLAIVPQVAKPLVIYGVDDLEWLNTLPNAKLDFPTPVSPIAQPPLASTSDSRTYNLWRQNPARRSH